MSSRNGVSDHHIHPTSRGGLNVPENKVCQSARKHAIYHILFYNLIPEEIVECLNRDYWSNRYYIAIERKCDKLCYDLETCGEASIRKREIPSAKEQFAYSLLFNGMTPEMVLTYLAEEWWGSQFNVFIFRRENSRVNQKEELFNRIFEPVGSKVKAPT